MTWLRACAGKQEQASKMSVPSHMRMGAMLPSGGFFDNWLILFEQVRRSISVLAAAAIRLCKQQQMQAVQQQMQAVRSSLSVLVLGPTNQISYALESSSKSTSHLLLFSHFPHFPLPFLSPPPLLLLSSSAPPPPMPTSSSLQVPPYGLADIGIGISIGISVLGAAW